MDFQVMQNWELNIGFLEPRSLFLSHCIRQVREDISTVLFIIILIY